VNGAAPAAVGEYLRMSNRQGQSTRHHGNRFGLSKWLRWPSVERSGFRTGPIRADARNARSG